ncbi:MAG TPA: hypothetical protein ENJ49_00075, partial [Candidatus Moranbacteria bacterium]|nr:hypothetical protein [Candidatus Moranbacteria bacterium]
MLPYNTIVLYGNILKFFIILFLFGKLLSIFSEALAKKYHIRRLSLFGSAARGELRPDSDIDL